MHTAIFVAADDCCVQVFCIVIVFTGESGEHRSPKGKHKPPLWSVRH